MYGNTVADNLSPAETEGLAGAITGPLRSPGQIWRQALSLYWRNWPELTAIAGAGYILLVIGALILGAGVFWLASLSTVPGSLLLAVLLVAGALYLSLIHCAILAAVALSLFENRPFSLQEIFGPVLRQGKNLVVAVLVLLAAAVVVLVMGGIPVLGWLVAPGVLFYLGVIGSLAPVALVAEALPGAWAVARGWRLSRLHFWRTLLVIGGPMLAGWLILALPTLAMLALNLPLQLTDIWLPLLLGVFVTPVYAAVAALAYVDLQVRRPEQAANPAGLVTPAELGKFALLSVGVVLVGGVLAAGGTRRWRWRRWPPTNWRRRKRLAAPRRILCWTRSLASRRRWRSSKANPPSLIFGPRGVPPAKKNCRRWNGPTAKTRRRSILWPSA